TGGGGNGGTEFQRRWNGARRGSRGCWLGCQSGPPGRQRNRELAFYARAKQQKAGNTQRRDPQARRSRTSEDAARICRNTRLPIQRDQACRSGTETQIRRNRNPTRRQKFAERLSNRKSEEGRRDSYDHHTP